MKRTPLKRKTRLRARKEWRPERKRLRPVGKRGRKLYHTDRTARDRNMARDKGCMATVFFGEHPSAEGHPERSTLDNAHIYPKNTHAGVIWRKDCAGSLILSRPWHEAHHAGELRLEVVYIGDGKCRQTLEYDGRSESRIVDMEAIEQ